MSINWYLKRFASQFLIVTSKRILTGSTHRCLPLRRFSFFANTLHKNKAYNIKWTPVCIISSTSRKQNYSYAAKLIAVERLQQKWKFHQENRIHSTKNKWSFPIKYQKDCWIRCSSLHRNSALLAFVLLSVTRFTTKSWSKLFQTSDRINI